MNDEIQKLKETIEENEKVINNSKIQVNPHLKNNKFDGIISKFRELRDNNGFIQMALIFGRLKNLKCK